MSNFVRIGSYWLNLDRIVMISRDKPDRVGVWFGGETIFLYGADGDRLWQYATSQAIDVDGVITISTVEREGGSEV